MKYTIKDKEYSEFDIKKLCAEIMGIDLCIMGCSSTDELEIFDLDTSEEYNPLTNSNDAGPIIEKVWDELISEFDSKQSCNPRFYIFGKKCIRWEYLVQEHGCTYLTAACICLIEVNS